MGLLGTILLYVGMVLMSNGLYRIQGMTDKSIVVMNVFTGGLGLIMNIVAMSYGICADKGPLWFYASATGLLFAFTYLYVAVNTTFDLDGRLYGWYSLFVAINTVPAGLLCMQNIGGNEWYGFIWWAWGILWLTGFIENNLKINLGKAVGWLGLIEGIVTAWIPGFYMLLGLWK
ncbi:MAG: AmiS/UreI family transporter [Veillonellaceae bacterium]|nr:AmiS/UreI family transporter [Veillonellaceae bacterium]